MSHTIAISSSTPISDATDNLKNESIHIDLSLTGDKSARHVDSAPCSGTELVSDEIEHENDNESENESEHSQDHDPAGNDEIETDFTIANLVYIK